MASQTMIGIALTNEERQAIIAIAQANGMTISQYIKSLLIANVPEYPTPKERRGGDRRSNK